MLVERKSRAFDDWNFFGPKKRTAEEEEQIATQQAILARRRNKGAREAYFKDVENSRKRGDEERKMWAFQKDTSSSCWRSRPPNPWLWVAACASLVILLV